MKKLYKSNTQKMVSGVCGGIAEFFDVDPTIVRILFVIFGFGGGSGFLLYLLAAVIMPDAPLTGDIYTPEEK